jgi:multicomponent Na+:H+ antiporter subunit C
MSFAWLASHYNYLVVTALMMGGLFIAFASRSLIKKMIGLAMFQTSAGLFYITLGKVAGGTAPVMIESGGRSGRALASGLDPAYVAEHGVGGVVYSNPLPSVLILTAIVVGVATLSVGLAIAVRIREAYGTIEADEIAAMDAEDASGEEPA